MQDGWEEKEKAENQVDDEVRAALFSSQKDRQRRQKDGQHNQNCLGTPVTIAFFCHVAIGFGLLFVVCVGGRLFGAWGLGLWLILVSSRGAVGRF